MDKTLFLLISVFYAQSIFAQIENSIYELNHLNDLITEPVQEIIDKNINGIQTVFLGEAVHYSGSDFLAKIEFVKYLVTKHNYKDIVFEGDFFALLFDHDKKNLYKMWSSSQQCEELFKFLDNQGVKIWGFDNRLAAPYTSENLTNKLKALLRQDGVELNRNFEGLVNTIIENEYKSRKKISKAQLEFIDEYIKILIKNPLIESNPAWTQIIKSLKSAISLYTVKDNHSDKKRIAIRDKQMAKNLDFLVKQNPNKKFIVWLANAHMSKSNSKIINGLTMGYQFRELNPKTSYHIAIGSIQLPPRNEKEIRKASKDSESILSILPRLDKNYFVNTREITERNSDLNSRIFNDSYIFNLASNKTKLLSHFDALVFIAYGEEVKYY